MLQAVGTKLRSAVNRLGAVKDLILCCHHQHAYQKVAADGIVAPRVLEGAEHVKPRHTRSDHTADHR